ncbi:MAG: 3-oxo-5alpha-steroid 4-dehydrogenase [Halioglobus sp.]|jgi:3-oxo-5alpha-steroid 4-dehydrogenase
MDNDDSNTGISRRHLLTGMGASAATTFAAGAGAVSSSQIKSWDIYTDVLVAGSGAGGLSAAIEARASGADVLVIESLSKFGGSSAMSGGVIYAGGGTSLQRALGIEDSPEDMYNFIANAGGKHPQLDKIQLYCEQSVTHFDWLTKLDVPYSEKFTAEKGLPMRDESLYYSGNEQAWPARDRAKPAPRGHVPGVKGMNGGRSLMEAMMVRAKANGVTSRANVAAEKLVLHSDGRIAGMLVSVNGSPISIRVRRGVVLACGGFIHNREMLKQYAPDLYDCSVPWGNAGDQGQGINMGIAVGAAALRMHEGFAIVPIYPPENVISGIVVNAAGQRFISEESYHGVLGNEIAFHQGGKAWLITDEQSAYQAEQDNFLLDTQANTIGDVADQVGFPRGSLQNTVAYYNRYAQSGQDPLFQKSAKYLRALQGPPYRAWDLSVDKAFFPAHTFGGLHTRTTGQVVSSFGEDIPGLYAAGRNTAGLPMAPYIASGLSVGDCTFFGRQAGKSAAAEKAS